MSFFGARRSIVVGVNTVVVVLLAGAVAADPSHRVARISFVTGVVSFHPAPAANWAPATLNYPMTTGDGLWTDANGRGEMQFGSAVVRLAANTSLSILGLEGHVAQFRLAEGSLMLNITDLAPDDAVEIDTPNTAVSLLEPGTYRIDVNAAGDKSTLTVRRGHADAITATTAVNVDESDAATVTGLTAPALSQATAAAADEWEDWAESRDHRTIGARARMFVSPEVIGSEDLDESGSWDTDSQSRPIWLPRVAADWAPYRAGHWSWVEPWGWTWIDEAPWGFAPFHYGRWTISEGRWAWMPGDIYARPIYAPALVAFVGAPAPQSGGAATIAWFPLGPTDMFEPAYRASPGYVRAINAAQIPLTSPAPTGASYSNRIVPGALTAVTLETFVRGQPVAAGVVPATASLADDAPVIGTAARVAPEAASVIAPADHAAMPPAPVLSRQVIARTVPPPPPLSFVAQQSALAQQPGRPLDDATLQSLRPVATDGRRDDPLVRVVMPK